MNDKELITGAEALMRSLEHQGVKTLFGYPGGSIMPVSMLSMIIAIFCIIYWCVMNKALLMRHKDLPVLRDVWAFAW